MKDRSISFVRLVSFSLITSCHFLQYFDNWLAWWLNVGVQVFLFMSGYLYGKREITSDILFYKKQLRKILIPYYVVVVVFIIVELLVCPEVIKESSIIRFLRPSLCLLRKTTSPISKAEAQTDVSVLL